MLYLFAASLLWSLSFGLIGSRLAGLPPAWLAWWRLALAAAVFLPFARRVPPRSAAALAGIGALQFGVMYLAYMSSFGHLASHEVALFTVLTPLCVAALHDLATRRLHTVNLAAAALAVLGAAAVLWRGGAPGASLAGFALVMAANLCFAAGQLAYRAFQRRAGAGAVADRAAMFWLYLGGAAVLAPLAGRDAWLARPAPTAAQLAVLAYLGTVASGLGFFLWNAGARRVTPGVLAVMNNAKIPLGVAVSLLLFGEEARLPALAAGALLVGAALLPPVLKKT